MVQAQLDRMEGLTSSLCTSLSDRYFDDIGLGLLADLLAARSSAENHRRSDVCVTEVRDLIVWRFANA